MKPAAMRLARNVASSGAKSAMRVGRHRRRTVEGAEFPPGLLRTRWPEMAPAILVPWISRKSSSPQVVPSAHT